MDFLNELNKNQRESVEYIDGPSLVIAGAGSGKTRVLTYKIAYLIKKGIAPSAILALTFTNKAAREMRGRIDKLVGEKTSRYLWMGTFHAVFQRILRREAEHTGYTKNFTIYDTADSKSLIKSIIKELKLDDKQYKPNFVQSRISFAKNNLITDQAYKENADLMRADAGARTPCMADIYSIYTQRCRQADAMDFDDLLLQTNLLFRNHPEILAVYQDRFAFILVDEYQDTNFAQYLIVKKLAERHHRISVVGDDAQSIYSFRGANIDNILKFKNSYPEAKLFKLEQNYRSTKTIVNAANSLIGKNKEQIRKNVYSEKEDGNLIKVLNVFTDLEEGWVVADHIVELHRSRHFQYKDIAVLYRTNSQSRVLEDALRKQHVPYRIYGGLSFYQRKEIKDAIAYFRLICNLNDEEALKRIINYPARGIGETTINKLFVTAQLHNTGVWEVLRDMLKYNLPVNGGIAKKLADFRDMIDVFHQQIDTQDAYTLATNIVKISGVIGDAFLDRSPENLSRQENIQELLSAIHEYNERQLAEEHLPGLLPGFLSEVSLLTDQDTDKDTESDRVTLMTVHAAKGLEFRAVFIVGMEEDLFPSSFSTGNERELEEERRLFYVAITRAEEQCFISYSKSRFRNGKTNFSNPSRFIKDIDAQYLELPLDSGFQTKQLETEKWDEDWNVEKNIFKKSHFTEAIPQNKDSYYSPPRRLTKIKSSSDEDISSNKMSLPVGTVVRHSVFGVGAVVGSRIVDGNEKVEIDFGQKGKKSLLLKFAKLEVLDK
ncbi:MAG: exodeoxyribonuclease V subunit gamma [Prevotellaceae bacterium]|jgi:DNA helicase-2/ATP-dependent DNA helicase PcrA|nr:exodeoxyribonuclease V subunit gamma [Prevotellaceae bacterium]